MIRGIGVDMVQISEIHYYIESDVLKVSFLSRTFTANERKAAAEQPNQAEYYATRFAVKEAVFKAVAPCCSASFDLRIVETLNHADGSPYVNISNAMGKILEEAQIDTLHVSITTEGDYATAFVIACKEK